MQSFNLKRIRIVLIFALVILNAGYALSLGFQSIIMVFSAMFIVADMLFSKNKIRLINNTSIVLVFIFLQFILAFIVNLDFTGFAEYIRLIVLYLFCYYVYSIYNSKELILAFANFMYFIAIVSLIFYIWIFMFPTLALKVQNGYGTMYATCFLSFVNVMSLERNCGIFWEPSVYAAVCYIWGIIEIFLIRKLKQRKMKIIVLILTIITTYSTSGYIYIFFLFIAFLLRNDSSNYSLRRMIFVIVLVSLGIIIYSKYDDILLKLVELNPLVFKKLIMNNASVTDRLICPLADLYVAILNPFGVGLNNLTSIVENVAYEKFGKTLHTRTSTITYYSAAFGMMSGFTMIVSIVNFVRRNVCSVFLTFFLVAGFLFMSISTPLQDSSIFIILLFIGIKDNDMKSIN